MGTSESCCKKDVAPVASKEFKEIIHAAPVMEAEDLAKMGDDLQDLRIEEVDDVDAAPTEFEAEHASEPDVSLDPRLLRGISLHRSLRDLGRVWKTAPSKLREVDHAFLSRRVTQVDGFDVFLSHTWQTSGRLKVWALLLRTGWPCILILWCFFNVMAASLYVAELLPYHTWYYDTSYNFAGWVPHGLWMRAAAILAVLMGLAVAPYRCSSEICFVDVVSINQADPRLTRLGVYGLEGFLSKSKELRVLWSPPLLSRLWCIFELAAFRKANPSGQVVLAPLYVETMIGMVMMGLIVIMITFMLAQILAWGEFGYISTAFSLLPILPLVHYVRRTLREKRRLVAALESFDLHEAGCSTDFDREFIHARISEWYGSPEAFTEYVRGPLFRELAGPLSGIQVPIAYWALIAAIETSSLLEFQMSYYLGGAPWDTLLSHFLASVLASVLWRVVCLTLSLNLCDWCSARSSLTIDLLKSFLVWILTCGILYVSMVLDFICQRGGPLTAALNALAAIFVAFLSLGGWNWLCRGRR
ncbi:unnamed protein product [Cladocopium goreaui]|uniref:Transketolase 2 n=1 Tax=Cladocopium goreaui TaxID=2562237 RepID=A0A9P1BSY0_9DINO|nr:unnamed protein product [Cladocopium goreaui]